MLDFIGIGLGPFNLSLASLLHDKSELQYRFFDQREKFDWHAGMQLPNAMLQVPFMADLVSMVEPTSPFSFLNYLKHHQRLYKFYFRENLYIPRQEYNHYCQWVVEQLNHIEFSSHVLDIKPIKGGFDVEVVCNGHHQHYRTRQLVLGVGTTPHLPESLQKIYSKSGTCLHSSEYLQYSSQKLSGNVVLIGSGQSAAEIFLDLFDRQYMNGRTTPDFHLYWLTRSAGFFPMENTPFGLEHFSPDYMHYFYHLPSGLKAELPAQQANLYKGISSKTIHDIYERLYHRSIGGMPTDVTLAGHHQLQYAELLENQKTKLCFEHRQQNKNYILEADCVIAATGYRYPNPKFLQNLQSLIIRDQADHWQVASNFKVNYQGEGSIFIQNMEIYHYGVGTPDLGLGAYRAATIANQLVGEELFKLDHSQSFQQFGVNVPAQEEVSVRNIAASKITEFSRPLNKSGPMHHSALGAYARSKLSEHIE
ncbi:SidA/IucD/PvdA family monooxygenase [Acinetobacter baumannii]|uniref:lysine N(6)-hydroxylase/L-ornithine N(5)-oxygenase family protein n=1 Tax=Acinetobacter baumannii TaxID=470 RepID=UPI002291EDE6|nr:SidA/IucD/PvdA family monooxygenase [Acinetobacter baumannii]MDL4665460.1 SidA/IucD/PvdA family monooxygenase [Acinetobacter baumannii]HCW4247394.1 SidA/IucD/PvdA family monooxygenase [Acinetobacter baumannii]